MSIRSRLLNLAMAADQFAWVLLTLGRGSPDETISAALWRMETQGKLAGRLLRPVVDWVALKVFKDANHCMGAFVAEVRRAHLPSSYQKERTSP